MAGRVRIMADSLKIEYVPIGKLKPFAGNPRKHPPEAVEKLVTSIEHFGWTNPVLVDTGGRVLAGHARLTAAKQAGIDTVPVIRLPLSGKDAELYVIADNKTAELTEWDWSKLGDLFGELDTGDIDLTLSGFTEDKIGELMHGLDSTIPSEQDWADAFEQKGDTTAIDGLKQITFVLDEEQHSRLVAHLKTLDGNKNTAMVKWLESLS